jgi:hypothetical protein
VRRLGTRARRLKAWLAPVTAAAVVIALAISLVIIRDLPNGRVVPPAGQASAVASVPKYYVALHLDGTKPTAPQGLLVGDTFTGARLATRPAPRGSTFLAVTGAADDRTFVLDAVRLPLGDGPRSPMWYLLRVTPGASSPVRLTRLPIPALPAWPVTALALSPSGRELAVTLIRQATTMLRIYSVATGKLLRAWSTSDRSAMGTAVPLFSPSNNALSWVDGDHALAFSTSEAHRDPKANTTTTYLSVRTLDVTAAGDDLIAASRAVWSKETTIASSATTYPLGCPWGPMPPLTADGKTVLCVSNTGSPTPIGKQRARWALAWLAYSTSAPKAARIQYKVVRNAPISSAFGLDTRWSDASGGTLIVDWGIGGVQSPLPLRFGVVSQGRFTPLPSPPGVDDTTVWGIAW